MKSKAPARFLARVEGDAGTLHLYDEIGGFFGITPKAVVDALVDMEKSGVKSLTLFVNSPGGDVFDGNAIFNAVKRFAGKKTVVVDGLAASMASVIAMAGDEIRMAPNAMMMIHEPWGLAIGDAEHMRERADLLDTLAENILGTYQRRTKQSAKDIAAWMKDETWMDAEEAVAFGFADSIVPDEEQDPDEKEPDEDPDDAGRWPMLSKFKRTPAAARALLARGAMASAHPAASRRSPPHPAALTEEQQMPEKNDAAAPVAAPAAPVATVTLTQDQFNAMLAVRAPAPVGAAQNAVTAVLSDALGGGRAPVVAKFSTPKANLNREERSDASASSDKERRALPLARLACAKAMAHTTGMPDADAADFLGFRKTAETIQGAAMSAGDTAAGGSFVPLDYQQGFIDMLDEIPRIASLIPAGNRYRSPLPVISIPTVTSGASGGWVSENPALGNPEALATGTKLMTARKQRIEVVVSRDLIRSAGNIDAIVLAQMIRRSAQLDDLAMVEGTGADGQPTGLEVDVHASAAMTASPDFENAHIDLMYLLKTLATHKVDLSQGVAIIMNTLHKYGLAGYMNPAGNAYPYADEMARGTLVGAQYRDSNLLANDKVYAVAIAELLAFEQLAMLLESDSTYHNAAGVAQSASGMDQVCMRLWRKVDFSTKHAEAIVAKTGVTWGV